MSVNTFFYTHPVFRYEEFMQWRQSVGVSTQLAAQKALQYYTKSGRLLNVRRGVYAVVPPTEDAQDLLVDRGLVS